MFPIFVHTTENQVQPETAETQAGTSEVAPEERERAGDRPLGNSSSQSNVRKLLKSVYRLC